MFSKTIMIAAIAMFLALPAIAGPSGCGKGKFYGSYTAASSITAFGDANYLHKFSFQLTLHSDGTANQFWTGLPDYQMNLGTGSPQIGSWTCRADGKLIINLVQGVYLPVDSSSNHHVTATDVELVGHNRTTYIFSVDDENTLTRIQSRNRFYEPNQDPTDPALGTLEPLSNVSRVYNRLIATDSDLTAP
jgi:hypothetical protein